MNLEGIESRADAATDGPWEIRPDSRLPEIWQEADNGWFVASTSQFGNAPYNPNDAAFIAAARTDVPLLVARVRELEGDLANRHILIERIARERRELVAENDRLARNLGKLGVGRDGYALPANRGGV